MFFNLRLPLVLVSLCAVFFISAGEARADTLLSTPSYRVHASSSYLSAAIDATTFTDLSLSFDFDATTLDFGPPQDSFTYGYQTGGNEYLLGTHLGLAGSTTAETGNIKLPLAAEVADLQIFVVVAANSTFSSDKVELRNIILTGELKPIVIIDVCANLAGEQDNVPLGYQANSQGDCIIITEEPIDVCLNLSGAQEILPQGYEINQSGDCVVISIPVDVCPNLEGEQEAIPNGYQKDELGNCIVLPPVEVDLCPNLEGVQITLPSGLQINQSGECVAIVVSPPKPKQCPRGFAKWVDRFKESYTWRADDVYQSVILVGGPTARSTNRDRAHFLYIAGPTEIGDKYYRRFHKISYICVKG